MNCFYFNARSIRNKIELLQAYAAEYSFDVVFITETWLNESITDGEIQLQNYNCFRQDRCGRTGGGVAIFVKKEIQGIRIEKIGQFQEALWYKIQDNGDSIIVGVVYRAPSTSFEEDENLIGTLREMEKYKRVMVVGDFNFPDIKWQSLDADTREAKNFLQVIQDNFWYQHINQPTRVNNILDLLLTSEEEMVECIEIGEQLGTADHNCIMWNCVVNRGCKEHIKEVLDWKKADWAKMKHDYEQINWQDYTNVPLDNLWRDWLQMYNNHIQKYVPKKVFQNQKPAKPKWMTKKLKKLIRKKRKLWRIYRENRSQTHWEAFKKLQVEVKEEISLAKKKFEMFLASKIKDDPKTFYSYVRSKQSIKSQVGPLKDEQGNIIAADKDTAEALNNFFETVFTEEDDVVPVATTVYKGDQEGKLRSLEITEEMVMSMIRKLKQGKAAGPDGVRPDYIKKLAEQVVKPISMIFQKSLNETEIPEE